MSELHDISLTIEANPASDHDCSAQLAILRSMAREKALDVERLPVIPAQRPWGARESGAEAAASTDQGAQLQELPAAGTRRQQRPLADLPVLPLDEESRSVVPASVLGMDFEEVHGHTVVSGRPGATVRTRRVPRRSQVPSGPGSLAVAVSARRKASRDSTREPGDGARPPAGVRIPRPDSRRAVEVVHEPRCGAGDLSLRRLR